MLNRVLRAERLKKKMRVQTLANLSGVHANTITGFELGRLNTGYKNVEALALVLGVNLVAQADTNTKNNNQKRYYTIS